MTEREAGERRRPREASRREKKRSWVARFPPDERHCSVRSACRYAGRIFLLRIAECGLSTPFIDRCKRNAHHGAHGEHGEESGEEIVFLIPSSLRPFSVLSVVNLSVGGPKSAERQAGGGPGGGGEAGPAWIPDLGLAGIFVCYNNRLVGPAGRGLRVCRPGRRTASIIHKAES